ncbi:MAG: FAD-dependent oxidoreductase [Nocardioides sp.]|uniref:oxidoreductase n=1 Tax=Nocardioides sp. TaxID=35761 RepID=UPI0039E36E42
MSRTEPATYADPLRLGAFRLRNRFVSAPMERNYGTAAGALTDEYVDYLTRRADGGAALVFTEASYVRADGKGRIRQLGMDTDEAIAGHARLAEEIHRRGALLGVELNHGGRTAQGAVSGYSPVAPSPIPCEVVGGEMPAALDDEEIEDLVECFGEAAARCQRAGVDVVSLHGGHGYLIHQFLSPAYNLREDEWADPTRFVNRVIDAVRRHAPGLTLGLRFSAFEGVPGGLTPELTRARMGAIDTDRLDFLDVSAGNYEAGQWIIQPGEWPRGLLREYAAPYRSDHGLPVGVAGRINTPQTAAEILAAGQADFLSLARTLHADPDFPLRALDGGRYQPCIGCNYCIDSLAAGPVPCSVNPWVRRPRAEQRHIGLAAAPSRGISGSQRQRAAAHGAEADGAVLEAVAPTTAESPAAGPAPALSTAAAAVAAPARVAVVGGGPAGLGVARELARSGLQVEVYDERAEPGGDFALAARLAEYPEYGRFLEWQIAELVDLGVLVHRQVRASADMLADREYDALVLASGGRGFAPRLPGSESRAVRDVRDFLLDPDPAPSAVTIYGGDREAAAVADDLLSRGTHVVLIAPQDELAADVGRRAKIVLLPRLIAAPALDLYLATRIRRVAADRVLIVADG